MFWYFILCVLIKFFSVQRCLRVCWPSCVQIGRRAGVPIQARPSQGRNHRVDRVPVLLSFFSSRRNWDSPNSSPAGECATPPLVPGGGGAHSLAGAGGEESQFRREDKHCGTLHMYVVFCGRNALSLHGY
jgi:hypothetical protein